MPSNNPGFDCDSVVLLAYSDPNTLWEGCSWLQHPRERQGFKQTGLKEYLLVCKAGKADDEVSDYGDDDGMQW